MTAAVLDPPRPLAPAFPARFPFELLLQYRRDRLGLIERARALGDVVRLPLTPRRVLTLVFAPQDVERVLVTHAANYGKRTPGYQQLSELLGQGLLTSEGELWRRQRRVVQPLFRRQHVASFAPLMGEAAAALGARWEALAAAGEPLDLAEAMGALALEVVGRSLFSADLSAVSARLGRAMRDTLRRFTAVLLTPLPGYGRLPTPMNLRGWRAARWLDRTVLELIAARRASGAPPEPPDLLALLMGVRDEQGRPMEDRLLRDEALTMLLAGHETTANALAWTFLLLDRHAEARARLEAEVDALPAGRAVGLEDLERLPWTAQVLDESLRLYPPAWMIARNALGEDVLGGYRVPAGSLVLLCQWAIHRHPALWEAPEEFRPERFAPEREAERPRWAWFPFGGGQRLCVGEGFARQEALIVLATLCRRFRVELLPGQRVEPEPSVTLRPRRGIQVRVRVR